MKTSAIFSVLKLSGKLLVLLTISLIMASCAGKKSENQNIAYSENALSLSRKMICVYNRLDTLMGAQEYQNELIKILNDVSPDTYIMKIGKNDKAKETSHFYKLNAFRSLEKVFIVYNLQLDPGVSSQTANLQEKFNAACNALDSLKLGEDLKMKNDRIKHAIKNSKFDVGESMFELTDLYAEFWNQEAKNWNLFLETNQSIIRTGIESIPVSSFNPEKIKSIVNDPYANASVLVNLYKLNLIKESQQKTNKLENDIQSISSAFGLLSQLQGELLKRNRNQLKIQDLNSAIEILLFD